MITTTELLEAYRQGRGEGAREMNTLCYRVANDWEKAGRKGRRSVADMTDPGGSLLAKINEVRDLVI